MSHAQESITLVKPLAALRVVLVLLVGLAANDAMADGWQSRAPVPGPRAAHSIVWTGSEAIVWGGGVDGIFLNTGARYSPVTDAWQVTSPYGAPAARWFHAAVWTGIEMIVWGGRANFFPGDHFNDGARYNPTTDSWTPISPYGAPTPRSQCAAVWTGEEMIVWGGETDGGVMLADGAAYNPTTDSWRPIANSGLAPRMEPTAVWTGSEMIVFGGVDATKPGWLSYGDGARYNPFTDVWTPLPTRGAPGSRTGHTAVWTGERMIVWGGRELPSDARLNNGASFHPGSDTWSGVSSNGAPQARALHAAVWTGSEMIVWGGDYNSVLLDTGARYNPATRLWTPTTQNNAPRQRMFWRPDHGIWTGQGMLVCAGSDYPASLDSTALYTTFDLPCPPVIVEQPQSVTVTEGEPVTLAVGARGCVPGEATTVSQNSIVPGSERFVFETGARSGELLLDVDAYTLPDSVRVYYEGQLIFETTSTGYDRHVISYGPGSATSVEIVMNEETGASPASVWEYTVRYRPLPVSYQWRKDGVALEGQINATLHLESARLSDAGDYAVVVSGNAGSTLSTVATVTVEPVGPSGCQAVPADLVAWWSAEGSANSQVGTNQGILSGGVGFAVGKVGAAFAFPNGGEGAVLFGASPVLDVGTSDGFTVEGWIQRTGSSPSGPIAEWNDGNRWGSHFWVLNDTLYANLTSPVGGWHLVFSSAPVTVGVWHHVAMSYVKADGICRLYLDGIEVSETSVGSFSPETAFDFYLGRRPAPASDRDSFDGLLDEFSLYRRALAAREIAAIHRAGAAGKCVSSPPPPPTNYIFNLANDFGLNANQNGPWSYGRISGSLEDSFERLNTTRRFGAENGVPIEVWFYNNAKPFVAKVVGPGEAVSYQFRAPAGTVYFGANPEAATPDFGVIRFTVPAGAGGLYRLTTEVRALYDGARSADSDFHVLRNAVELFNRLVGPNSSASYSNVLMLASGDKVDFVAGEGSGLPDTGLKIQSLFEPVQPDSVGVASVALMPAGKTCVTGFAPAGTICRVERSTNLKDWELVGTARELGNGCYEFIDLETPTGTACFYRMLKAEE